MAGNKHLEELDRPFLQGLGEQGVIGVGQRAAGDVPGLIPGSYASIQQYPHQFGNGKGRMRIVHLDGHLLRQHGPIPLVALRCGRRCPAIEQLTMKYCCSNLKARPASVESSGYSTRVRDSAATFWMTAPAKSPCENSAKSNDCGAAAAQRRSVLMQRAP